MTRQFEDYMNNAANFKKSRANMKNLVVDINSVKSFKKTLSPFLSKRIWRADLIDNSKSIMKINYS